MALRNTKRSVKNHWKRHMGRRMSNEKCEWIFIYDDNDDDGQQQHKDKMVKIKWCAFSYSAQPQRNLIQRRSLLMTRAARLSEEIISYFSVLQMEWSKRKQMASNWNVKNMQLVTCNRYVRDSETLKWFATSRSWQLLKCFPFCTSIG